GRRKPVVVLVAHIASGAIVGVASSPSRDGRPASGRGAGGSLLDLEDVPLGIPEVRPRCVCVRHDLGDRLDPALDQLVADLVDVVNFEANLEPYAVVFRLVRPFDQLKTPTVTHIEL